MTAHPSTPDRIGRYRIVSLVAAGGMGSVYRAEDPEDGKPVAVKLLPAAFGKQEAFVERFKREARIGMTLSHEAIPKVYEFGIDAGRYYLAMEWLEGKNLRAWLAERTELPDDETWRAMFGEICRALLAAHQQGILHRDLTEGNVVVMPNGGIRITDFGLSAMVSESHFTVTGEVLGTPHYSAPEQIQSSKDVREPADLWSLGVIGYQIATGRRPFDGESATVVIARILNPSYAPPPARNLNAKLSALSDSILQKCLQRDLCKRYRSAVHVIEDLSGAAGAPVDILRSDVSSNAPAGVKSNKAVLIAAGILFALAAGGAWFVGRGTGTEVESDDASAPSPDGTVKDETLPDKTSVGHLFDHRMVESFGGGRTALSLRAVAGGIKTGKAFLLVPHRDGLADDALKPEVAPRVPAWTGDRVPIRYVALSVENVEVGPEEIVRIGPFMPYTVDFALSESRKYRNPMYASVLRVYRLPALIHVPKMRGRNWIHMQEEISLDGAAPVMSDDEFGRLRTSILMALKGNVPK
ncbi:MAG: hypothetical protein A3G34_09295 [Candidatus Lindowbacteria bacterium RIFCSPLOWO2_12_FULL_62_27]|nr:MAG: hypothetical protein A3I06_07960 [Candidatus Lindowbacteria bacterium RIFCSPLOWO2_02_FULL_62_12]OGH60232.1 MAG: hypothetical protein A3G34_09295 [Candidatus Lindowbacteria bacterium RIFCSPLOWO2_12_FULL_62_27]